MYFKFIIFLISFILATNSVMGNLEEHLQKSYDFAREIYYVPSERGLRSLDISNFVEHDRYRYVKIYFQENEITLVDQENINFELFTKIIKAVCEANGDDIFEFLTERIEELKSEVKECEEFYDLAKRHYHVSAKQGLTESNLIEFLGTNIKKYIIQYLENNFPVEKRENVDLKLFTNVVRAVCKANGFYERQFLFARQKEIKGKAKVVEEEEEEEEEEE